VPKVGLEPTLPFEKSILSAPRLPFRHFGQRIVIDNFSNCSRKETTVRLDKCNKVFAMAEASSKLRVIVAEDESLIRMDIVEILRENDFDVIAEAGDGEEAVALAAEHKPDLIVMDIKMPKMDGISAAEQIAKLSIPVVLLTAFSQTELVERASAAGAMAFLVKPFTPNDLLPAIRIALSRHDQIAALEAEISDLNERFETRKLVERAKGLLLERGLNEPEAFRWIQKVSMDRRLTMKQVAQSVIEQFGNQSAETKPVEK
jgi:AmiR/NasT family two-component response regulator